MSLNKQGEGKIDWTDFTLNPISGCKHGCSYCYMNRMEKRFPGIMEPKFHPERLRDIAKLKKPSKIFAGSSGDMWGEWVPGGWIKKVLEEIEGYPNHIFQFLTKAPYRYGHFTLPENGWYGTTIDGTHFTKYNLNLLKWCVPYNNIRFISFEPLLNKIPKILIDDLGGINWVIIGANSNKGAEKPPKEWADMIIKEARKLNIAIWIKDNYGYPERIKEFPK